jgi:hypothetical protein
MNTEYALSLDYGDYNMLAANLEKIGLQTWNMTEQMFAEHAQDTDKVVVATYQLPAYTDEDTIERYYLVVAKQAA